MWSGDHSGGILLMEWIDSGRSITWRSCNPGLQHSSLNVWDFYLELIFFQYSKSQDKNIISKRKEDRALPNLLELTNDVEGSVADGRDW